MYFSLLKILEMVEMWLDTQPAIRKCKPLVAPPPPRKLRAQIGNTTTLGCPVPTQPPLEALPHYQPPQTPWLSPWHHPGLPAPPSPAALLVPTLVPTSQLSTPQACLSHHGSPFMAAAHAVQHTLVIAAYAVTTVVD